MPEALALRRPVSRPSWVQATQNILRRGEPLVLVTVAQVRGSAPRDAGAKMWVDALGSHDTIGGGRLEQQAIELAGQMLADAGRQRRQTVRYPLGARLGQCCGGVVWLSFEYLDRRDLRWCDELAARLEAEESVLRRVIVPLDGVDAAGFVDQGESDVAIVAGGDGPALPGPSSGAAREAGSGAQEGGRKPLCTHWDERSGLLSDVVSVPALDVVVCGAGHVGRAIVRLLGELPVRVTWLDPRDDWWPETIPGNVVCLEGDADDVRDCPDNAYWLVLTHSHALDLEIIEQIFRHKPFRFLGLIGSSTKKARFISQLRQRFPGELVDRMQCPIGLVSTSSKLPSVIAVSVVAQLLPLLDESGNPL